MKTTLHPADVTRIQNQIESLFPHARCYTEGKVRIGDLEFQFGFTPADDFFGDPAALRMLHANKFSHFTTRESALAAVEKIVG